MKIWYIQIAGVKEGPYDIKDLRRHSKVTPDTLAWRKGFSKWLPMREISELDEVFKDPSEEKDEVIRPRLKNLSSSDEVLTLQYDSNHWKIWILILLIIAAYVYYQLG